MNDTVKKEKIKGLEKTGFMAFSTSNNIVYNFKNLYYLTFLTMVLKIPVGIAGVMLTIGTIWDAVNDPLIALYCANRRFKSGEKVRPYALWCCIPWSISVVLLFVNFHLTTSLTVAIGLIIYFIFEALYTFLCIPYNSLATLATQDDSDRRSINAFRSIGSCLGTGIGAVAILPLVKLFGGLQDHKVINESDSKALLLTALVMGVICVSGSLFHYFTSKERIRLQEGEKEEKIGLFQAYKMLFKCKSWILNMFYVIGYGVSVALVMQNVNYYAAFIIGNSSAATPILAVYLVMAVLTGVFGPQIDKAIGRKKTMLLAIFVMLAGKIPFMIAPDFLPLIYINAATVGFGLTITFILMNTNRNNIADVLEVQNGRRIDTLVAGGDNLISKLAEAFAIQMITLVYSLTGMDVDLVEQTPQTIHATQAFLGWVPFIVAALMIFCVIKMDIKKELEESKAKLNA